MPASRALAQRPSAADAGGAGAWLLPPLFVLLGIFFYPLALIVRQAGTLDDGAVSLAPLADLLTSAFFQRALLNTFEIATAATAGCLALGFVLALVLSFVPFPGGRFVARLIDCVIALPTFLVTLAFTFVYGSAGILNVGLMQAFHLDLPPV